jgi:hypothetical protein
MPAHAHEREKYQRPEAVQPMAIAVFSASRIDIFYTFSS